jgi:hypothetical protein
VKNFKNFVAVCLVTVLVALCSIPPVNASGSNEPLPQPNYEELFNLAMTSDGAWSEAVAAELAEAFDNDAESLIDAMSVCDPAKAENVAKLLVYGKTYGDVDAFSAQLEEMLTAAETEDAESVLELILSIADDRQTRNTRDPSEPPPTYTPPSVPAFDKETLLLSIELNETTTGTDAEFFHLIGKAYRADPKLFAEIISDRSAESVAYLAKAIAYDCISSGDYAQETRATAVDNAITSSNKVKSVLSEIESAIGTESNGSLNVFYDNYTLGSTWQIGPQSTQVPTIGTMTYSLSTPLYVNDSETLRVTFTESTASSTTRTYWTEVYCIRNGASWLKATGSVTISSGSTSTTKSYSMSFSDVGPVYTLVKVYSSNGGSLLASRQGTNPDTVKGKWKITVSCRPTELSLAR